MKVLARIESVLARVMDRPQSDEDATEPKRIDRSADRRVPLAEAHARLVRRRNGVAPSIHEVWKEMEQL